MSETPVTILDRWLDEQQGTMTRRERLIHDAFPHLGGRDLRLILSWLRDAVAFGIESSSRTPDPRVSALVEAGKEAREILADLAHPDDSQRSVSSQVYWARCVAAEVKIRTALAALAAFEADALKAREG